MKAVNMMLQQTPDNQKKATSPRQSFPDPQTLPSRQNDHEPKHSEGASPKGHFKASCLFKVP